MTLDAANDAVTAVLAVAVAAILRITWQMHGRVSRLEGLDEGRARGDDTETETET